MPESRRTVVATADDAAAVCVVDLLERQAARYRELRRLVERQRQLIVRDQTAPLLTLLAERQKLTAELSGLAAQLTPYRRDWQRIRDSLTAPQRQTAERHLQDVERTVRELLETDEADARLLGARKATTRQSMSELAVGRQAVAAYQQSSQTSPSGTAGVCLNDEPS